MTNEYAPYLNLAIAAATNAGQFLLNNIGKYIDIIAEEEREIHFRFDLEAEKIIIDKLRNGSAYKIITEESGLITTASVGQEYAWIVDPPRW